MIIDAEAIERVLSGQVKDRGCGKTFAMLCVVAGVVELSPNRTIGLMFSSRNTLMYQSWKFLTIVTEITENEIMVAQHKRGEYVVFNNGCRVEFLNKNTAKDSLRGRKFDDVYVDHFILETLSAEERSLLDNQINSQIR
jgi:hydrogenase maturation factor